MTLISTPDPKPDLEEVPWGRRLALALLLGILGQVMEPALLDRCTVLAAREQGPVSYTHLTLPTTPYV